LTLARLGDESIQRFGEYEALAFEGRRLTNVDQVRAACRVAHALRRLGVETGDRVVVMLPNCPEVMQSYGGILRLGAVIVPVIFLLGEAEVAHILADSEAKVVITSSDMVWKVERQLGVLPTLHHVLLVDGGGAGDGGDEGGVRSYSEEITREPDSFEPVPRVETDLAVILYTSGTTGAPKGAMLSYRNLIATSRLASEREGLRADDEAMAYLPMAWVGDNVLSYAQAIVTGFAINCPESAATVLPDLKEIGPTYFFAPPRIWESILTNVMIRIEDAAWLKRMMVKFFLALAQDLERARLSGRPLLAWRRLLAPLGEILVYGPLRDNLGMRRIRIAYTAGEAIGAEIIVFFRALGINVKQLYGMTEASVFVAVQKDGDVRLDTVGTPMPQVEIKISEQGEVMFRTPGVFQGYFKNPEATQATLVDGWIRHQGRPYRISRMM